MTRSPARKSLLLAAAVAAASLLTGGASADASDAAKEGSSSVRDAVLAYRVDARLRTPAAVAFDAPRLGHAVLPARLTLTNHAGTPVPLGARKVDFLARGTLAVYPCEVRAPEGDRWPATLDPGESVEAERTVACETTLPGAYVLEARWASAPTTDAPLASAPFQIEPGQSPPVPLSTRPALLAVATGTREADRPQPPGRVRIVLGLANATARAVPLPTIVIETSLHLRGSPLTCKDRREVPLTGELGPGRQHVVWMPLSCALPTEGVWEVDVDVGEPSGPPVRLPRHVVRVSAVTTPPPPPR